MTSRAAKGIDIDWAAAAAVQELKAELRSILLNKPEDIPEFTTGEISEIDEETAREIPSTGCTWYPDDYPSPN